MKRSETIAKARVERLPRVLSYLKASKLSGTQITREFDIPLHRLVTDIKILIRANKLPEDFTLASRRIKMHRERVKARAPLHKTDHPHVVAVRTWCIEERGVTLEQLNTSNKAYFYLDELKKALRGEPYSEWGSTISAKEKAKMKKLGLIIKIYVGNSGREVFPSMLWVRCCYPRGIQERWFPGWKEYVK